MLRKYIKMKIYGYTAFATGDTSNTTLKSKYVLLTARLKQGNGYYWHYDSYEGVENALEELKKCNGYLMEGTTNVDLTKLKLISECTDEELENYIRMEKKL